MSQPLEKDGKLFHLVHFCTQFCIMYIHFIFDNFFPTFYNNDNNNKITSLAPISSENLSSVAHQNQRTKHSRDHVQYRKSSTDGWRCQQAKDRQFKKNRYSDDGKMKLYFLLILCCPGVNSTE